VCGVQCAACSVQCVVFCVCDVGVEYWFFLCV